MKKYLRLKCTVCKRDIDKLVNLTHYSPDQCTITLGCEGRLRPVEYRSNGGVAIAPEIGVTDWYPRNEKPAPGVKLQTSSLVNLETGPRKQLVLAVPSQTGPDENVPFVLNLTVQADTPKDFRQYLFRKEGAFSTISGVESGLEKKALRFTTSDEVDVFVNGVKLEKGTDPEDYQIYDGTDSSGIPPNTIKFNTLIESSSITQVDVIVSRQVPASTIGVVFARNRNDESRVGAFENVSSVQRLVNGQLVTYYTYTADLDSSGLPLNTILVPEKIDAFFLLARKPYTKVDRYNTIIASLEDLSAERDYIKYYAEDGVTTARITDTSLSVVFPPLRMVKFEDEKTIKTASAGIDEQVVIDGSVIVGPDS